MSSGHDPPADASQRSLRVLLCSGGTRGDVQPVLSVAKELLERGHSPVVCLSKVHVPWAKSVLPSGVELKEAAGGEPLEPQPSWVEGTTRIADLLVPHERDAVQTFRQRLVEFGRCFHAVCNEDDGTSGRPDAILTSSLLLPVCLYIAHAVAGCTPIPVWECVFAPVSRRLSSSFPPNGAVPSSYGAVNVFNHLTACSPVAVLRWSAAVAPAIAALRQEKRLTKPRGAVWTELAFMRRMHSCPQLQLHSPLLCSSRQRRGRTPTTDYPDPASSSSSASAASSRLHTVCGFALLTTPAAALPAPLEAFLASGEPPVCVGFGSMLALDDAQGPLVGLVGTVVEAAVRAAHICGRRCVIVLNLEPADASQRSSAGLLHMLRPQEGNDDVYVDFSVCVVWGRNGVAHELLFPRCAAVVHHGGAGTTARCLLHGTPAVLVPILQWFDQPAVAAAVRRLRTGAVLQLSSKDLAAAARQLRKQCVVVSAHRAALPRSRSSSSVIAAAVPTDVEVAWQMRATPSLHGDGDGGFGCGGGFGDVALCQFGGTERRATSCGFHDLAKLLSNALKQALSEEVASTAQRVGLQLKQERSGASVVVDVLERRCHVPPPPPGS